MGAIEFTDTALDDIAFLARSEHRLNVMGSLVDTGLTRGELRDETEIIQPTLGRVLRGFEERGWVEKSGSEFALTAVGSVIAEQFEELVDVVETMRVFSEVSSWLPLEEMGFDLRRFANAEITTPSPTDATANLRREDEIAGNASHVRHLCSSAFPPHIKTYRDRIVNGDQAFEAVITGDALDAAASNPETAEWVRDIAGSGNATVYRYEGPVSYQIGTADDTALIVPLDDTGAPCAVIETTDPVIYEWVTGELDRFQSRSTPLA